MMSFPFFSGNFFTFTPPGLVFIFRFFSMVYGEEVIPSKEESDAGSARASLLPTSQKPWM